MERSSGPSRHADRPHRRGLPSGRLLRPAGLARRAHHSLRPGLLAAAATAAALYERVQTGLGQPVVVSGLHAMAEVACPISGVDAMSHYRGSPIGGSSSYRLYQCGDGEWLFLGALFSHFFYGALEALDLLGGGMFDIGEAIQDKLMSAPRDALAGAVPRQARARRRGLASRGLAGQRDHAGERPGRRARPPRRSAPVKMLGVAARLDGTPGSVRRLPTPAGDVDVAAFAAPRAAADGARPGASARRSRASACSTSAPSSPATYAASILANFGADVVKVGVARRRSVPLRRRRVHQLQPRQARPWASTSRRRWAGRSSSTSPRAPTSCSTTIA